MTEVAVTGRTPNFGPCLPQRVVLEQGNGLGIDGLVKRRPTTMAVEFGAGDEQFGTASAAGVKTSPVLLQQFTRPRAFGAGLAKHVKLFGGQSLAPLGVASLAGVFCHAHY